MDGKPNRKNERVLQVRISDELKEKFDRIIKEKSINKSELLRKLVIDWIEKNS